MRASKFAWKGGVIFATFCVLSVSTETTWVWNPNSAQTGRDSQNSNFGQVNFGRDRDRFGQTGKASIFPESPSRPSSSSKDSDSSALPADTIRVVNNGDSEARLIPGAASFVSNALQSIGVNGNSGGTGGGLLSIGGNLIGSIFQAVPQIAGSAFEILLGRPSKGNSGTSSSSSSSKPSNGIQTLPASTSGTTFPILSPGGGSNSGRPNFGSSLSGGSGGCRCIPATSCFLPNKDGGSCSGGIMCCSSTRTRSVTDDEFNPVQNTPIQSAGDSTSNADVRLGLLENIVKGGGNVVDDALDLLLLRYYTPDDKQKLANRVLKNG